jgi:hypothetical protein
MRHRTDRQVTTATRCDHVTDGPFFVVGAEGA